MLFDLPVPAHKILFLCLSVSPASLKSCRLLWSYLQFIDPTLLWIMEGAPQGAS